MDKERSEEDIREQLLKNFEQVKSVALNHLLEKNFIKNEEEVNIKNVIRYNKDVELTKKDSEGKDKSKFKLYVVEWENTNPDLEDENPLGELEFLVEEDENGNIINIHTIEELIKDFEEESFKNIRDVVDKTKENGEKPEEEQDEELKKDTLKDLEEEKKEEKEEDKEEKGKKEKIDETKNDLTGSKPKYVMQTVDVDQAYVDNWTSVRKAYGLPSQVKELAIAMPMQKDDHILSDSMTIYMLDENGRVIENVNGNTIESFFEIDDSTGNNPVNGDETKLGLQGYAKVDDNQTMRRFVSKKDPELFLSIEQKEIGGYHEVYAGGKTRDGNDSVEIQLETRNVEIQTDFEMQEIISGRRGIYSKEEIDREASEHGAHEEKIEKENADGDELTRKICESPFVPDTEITWEQFAKSIGDKEVEELAKEFFEQYNGENGKELVIGMQDEYKERSEETEKEQEREEVEVEEDEGRVPWDRPQH